MSIVTFIVGLYLA